MTKGQRRNKFLLQDVQPRMIATVNHLFSTVDLKLGDQLEVSAPHILRALSLAYQKGIADAFDTVDGRDLNPFLEEKEETKASQLSTAGRPLCPPGECLCVIKGKRAVCRICGEVRRQIQTEPKD